ncbi:MAG: Na/Pi cotransporter family protein [Bacilli bacterium]|nr:Na/Pi cotransporter family protein [Bacilli bacterium]MDY4155384.1 Na/Pi cotransporter family protein [Bacilli bacterium]MDY5655058.1 Na/Pi cotransporter family protein [Bacilli bacterium]MDY5898567.1 Na/Pi cotransporter family protein [Bacilli bacterium]
MTVFLCILALLAGSGVFMAGMNMLSSNLEKIAGNKMKSLLGKISNNRFAGVGIGASVTAIIQSSAATTVMAIGFVNAGVMTLMQATAIIMGANIGTTVTGLLVSLSSFDISLYFSVFTFIGIMMMFIKNDKVKIIGGILAGLGLLFVGLDLMSNAFNDPAIKEFFIEIFTSINFPLLLILCGIVFTALLQSSSAATGLVIVMVGNGAIDVSSALFIILGSNIGTCVTAIIASIGTTTNAKRTAFIHLAFNVIGTIIFTIFIWIFTPYIVSFLDAIFPNNGEMQIALFHIIFNVTTTLLLLPFIKWLVRLAELVIREKKKESAPAFTLKYVDDRLLKTPPIALMQVKKEVEYMASLANENLERSFDVIFLKDKTKIDKVYEVEEHINFMNNALTKYLIKLSSLVNSDEEKIIGSYFHVLNDIERIGDHAENFLEVGIKLIKNNLSFSKEGEEEVKTMYSKVLAMYDLAIEGFDDVKKNHLKELDKYEQQLDDMKDDLSSSHFDRLADGKCSIEMGDMFYSIISGLERVGDHLVNVGYSIFNPTGSQTLNAKNKKKAK